MMAIKTTQTIEHLVYSGSGHNGPRKFDDYETARLYAFKQAAVPSYARENQRTHAQLVRKVTITSVEDIW